MFTTNNRFANTATAIVGAVLMSATCMAIAVSPARAATPAATVQAPAQPAC